MMLSPVRRIGTPHGEKVLYLTFDDGPHPSCTGRVLELLDRHKVRATFFVVAERARAQRALLKHTRSTGHTIGNHSLDHRYRHYFSRRERLCDWIWDAEVMLQELTGSRTVGFRSPAGVRTPRLHWALRELDLPLIHWSVRFYDVVWGWSLWRARRGVARVTPGDIILLHDVHEGERQREFLLSLDWFIRNLIEDGYIFRAIERGLV